MRCKRSPRRNEVNQPVVEVFSRNVYGVAKIYPTNPVAQKFAVLLGVKTFNSQQLQQIAGLGFKVNAVVDPGAAIQVAAAIAVAA
jgi:hypothetical protein